MQEIGVRELRRRISHFLNAAQAGEEVVIMQRGKPAARLVPLENRDSQNATHFPDRSAFRDALPAACESSAELVRQLRDERG